MHVILPITNVAEHIWYYTDAVLQNRRHSSYVGFDIASALAFSQQLTEYLISDALMWTDQPVYEVFIERLLCEYLPWWEMKPDQMSQQPHIDRQTHVDLCNLVYTQAIDPQECRLREIIGDIIQDDERWLVWYTTTIHNDIALSKGEDYRIIDFEQRVLSNTLRVSERAKRHIFDKNMRPL